MTEMPTVQITRERDSAYGHRMYAIALEGKPLGFVEGPIENRFWRVQTPSRDIIHRYAYSRREAIEYLVEWSAK